jgi:hypothetical protein
LPARRNVSTGSEHLSSKVTVASIVLTTVQPIKIVQEKESRPGLLARPALVKCKVAR